MAFGQLRFGNRIGWLLPRDFEVVDGNVSVLGRLAVFRFDGFVIRKLKRDRAFAPFADSHGNDEVFRIGVVLRLHPKLFGLFSIDRNEHARVLACGGRTSHSQVEHVRTFPWQLLLDREFSIRVERKILVVGFAGTSCRQLRWLANRFKYRSRFGRDDRFSADLLRRGHVLFHQKRRQC